MTDVMKGQCVCGAVGIESAPAREIGACHCRMCRRWGGGPLLAVHCGTALRVVGETQLRVFRSSDWAERAFCGQCGTHLYYKLLPTGEHFVPAGIFEQDDFHIASQLFIDSKPAYYDFTNDTPMLTGQQVMAQFDGGSDAV